jgi:hypothetical protein
MDGREAGDPGDMRAWRREYEMTSARNRDHDSGVAAWGWRTGAMGIVLSCFGAAVAAFSPAPVVQGIAAGVFVFWVSARYYLELAPPPPPGTGPRRAAKEIAHGTEVGAAG